MKWHKFAALFRFSPGVGTALQGILSNEDDDDGKDLEL